MQPSWSGRDFLRGFVIHLCTSCVKAMQDNAIGAI
jgi:hypothetical protein